MKAYTLFSGSTGNCFFAHTEETNILIDCGVSARCVEKALCGLGFSLSDINAVFVTHEHCDHTKGLEIISKYHHIPVYMQEKSARALIHDPSSAILQSLYLYNGEFSVRVGDISVSAFMTPHDSAASVGYIIEADERKIGYVTDMGCILPSVRDALSGCDASVIEANHDVGMLMMGPYPFYLKERIRSEGGHLSNVAAGELAHSLAESGTKSLLLGHLSKENNTPALALDTVRSAVSDFPDLSIAVASPDKRTELIIK